MTFLAALLPMLQGDSEFRFKVNKTPTGIRIVTTPHMKDFQPDTSDEQLGRLQAALALPLVFNINDLDAPDRQMALLLEKAAGIRQVTLDDLTVYQDAQREAQQAARAAQDKKAAAKKPDKAGKPAATTTTPAAAETPDIDEEGEGGIALTDVAAPSPPITAPIALFD